MPSRDDAYLRHQQKLWLRPDGDRWVRPDAARFLAPGADVVAAFPVLARKYSASQPRVPAGNGIESGRWTDGSSSGRPRIYIDTTDLDTSPDNDVHDEIDSLGLFGITPREPDHAEFSSPAIRPASATTVDRRSTSHRRFRRRCRQRAKQ